MNIKLLIFMLFSGYSILFSQTDTTLIALKGFEDIEGNTYLSYTTRYSLLNINADSNLFSYNVFDVKEKKEFVIDKGYEITYYPENHSQVRIMGDIEFFNNNPTKYIYATTALGIDPDTRINRYDSLETSGFIGAIEEIYISSVDTNIIYGILSNEIIKSFDAGYTWSHFAKISPNDVTIKFLTFSPFDEAIIFGINSSTNIVKSLDTGKTFFEVNNLGEWNKDTKLFFDKDRKHIYAIKNHYEYNSYVSDIYSALYVSDNIGNPSTWELKKDFGSRISLCLDDSTSGTLFYSVGNEIYKSQDYGNTFVKYSEAPHHPISMHKKTNSEELFAAVSDGIIKILPNTVEYLLKKTIKKNLDFFPLGIGNKWIYQNIGGPSNPQECCSYNTYYSQEITKDSIDNTGLHYYYFEVESLNENFWVRIDSVSGNIYHKYFLNDEKEYLFANLVFSSGDEYETMEGIVYDVFESDTLLWDSKRFSKRVKLHSLFTYEKVFIEGIGITKRKNEYDFGSSEHTLKGCIINGIIYGDTTVVGIKKINNSIPTNFVLSQNYPNPFNPTTIIKYIIPTNVVVANFASTTRLKVYDILGKEVTTLVNKVQSPGSYEVTFNSTNLSSGIYYYQLKSGSFVKTKKMIILR